MPSVNISDANGIVESGGSGTTIANSTTISGTTSITGALTLNTLPKGTLQAKTAAATLTEPGVYTVSGSAAIALTMPLASSVPGGIFTIRTLSDHAHTLTGSAEANGTLVFSPGSTLNANGSNLAVAAVEGSSASVISDGLSYCVLASSGSVTISGT